jgi:hypothetical protein
MALSALEGMVKQIASSYIPMGIEHDPRIAPLGRIVSARIVELDDGEHALDAEVELFEGGDIIPFDSGSRRATVHYCQSERVCITDDRVFRDEEDQRDLADIADLLQAERRTEGKKALEPIAVLIIGAKLTGAAVLGGFGKKIGEDAWKALRTKLTKVFSKKRPTSAQLLTFAITAEIEGEPRLVEIVLSDPEAADIDGCKPEVIEAALQAVIAAVQDMPYLIRFHFAYSATGGLNLRFAVAMNGVPVVPKIGATASNTAKRLDRAPDA